MAFKGIFQPKVFHDSMILYNFREQPAFLRWDSWERFWSSWYFCWVNLVPKESAILVASVLKHSCALTHRPVPVLGKPLTASDWAVFSSQWSLTFSWHPPAPPELDPTAWALKPAPNPWPEGPQKDLDGMAKPHHPTLHGASPDAGRALLSLCGGTMHPSATPGWVAAVVRSICCWLCLARCLLVPLSGDGFASVTHGFGTLPGCTPCGISFWKSQLGALWAMSLLGKHVKPGAILSAALQNEIWCVPSVCLGREKKRRKNPTFCAICWCLRTGDQQAGSWGSTRESSLGALKHIPSSLDPLIPVLYMLMHTRPSLACLLFPGFTRCTTADSPEAQADMEAGKPTTCHREPRLQLKQRNHRPQIHSQLLSQTQDFISRVIFSRSLLLVLPADIMWLLLQTTSLRGLVDFFFSEFCGTHVFGGGWENLSVSQGCKPLVTSSRPMLTCFAPWLRSTPMLLRALSALQRFLGLPLLAMQWLLASTATLRVHNFSLTKPSLSFAHPNLHHSTSCSLKWFLKCCKVSTRNREQEYVIIEAYFTCRHQTQCHREPSERQVKFLQKIWFPRSLCGLFINPEIFLRSLYYPEQGCVLFACCFLEITGRQLTGR